MSPDRTSFNKSQLCQSAKQFASGMVKESSRTLSYADSTNAYWVYILPLKWLGMKQESLITFILPDSYLPVLYSVSPENSIYLPLVPPPPTWLAGSAWLQVQLDTEQSQECTGLPCSRSHVEAGSAVKALGKHAAFVEIWDLGIIFFSSTGPCFRVWGPQLGFPYLRDTLTSLRASALMVPMTTLGSPE